MGNINVTPVKVTDVNVISANLAFNAVTDTSDYLVVDVAQSQDKKLVFIVDGGTAGATVTVKAGENIAGVNDLVLTVAKNEKGFFQLDSNAYMNASGENKGKILIGVSATTCTLAVAEMR